MLAITQREVPIKLDLLAQLAKSRHVVSDTIVQRAQRIKYPVHQVNMIRPPKAQVSALGATMDVTVPVQLISLVRTTVLDEIIQMVLKEFVQKDHIAKQLLVPIPTIALKKRSDQHRDINLVLVVVIIVSLLILTQARDSQTRTSQS